ncbi:MAG: hypothetical protein GEU73_09885 [Chloroflexi bacterium]|nr:hypothetical protein [Chloroflexota bacterium]
MAEGRAALWTLVGIFVVFKLATTAMMIAAHPGAVEATIAMFVAFHWPFVLVGAVLGAGPLLFWLRLVRVRAKRKKLTLAEWRTD